MVAASHCGVCARPIPKRQKYCSRACSGMARRRPASKVCEQCGAVFHKPLNRGKSPWERRRFCSRACRDASFKRRAYFTCEGCGEQVETVPSRVSTRRFCARCNDKFAHRPLCLASGKRLGGDSKNRLMAGGFYRDKCEICGFDRCYVLAHIIRPKDGGTMDSNNILTLCPNHHYLFDRGLLTKLEYAQIRERVEAAKAHFKEQA